LRTSNLNKMSSRNSEYSGSCSSRASSPEVISPLRAQRECFSPIPDEMSILRSQVNLIFREMDNTNRTVQNLSDHVDLLNRKVDNEINILHNKIDELAITIRQMPTMNQIESLIVRVVNQTGRPKCDSENQTVLQEQECINMNTSCVMPNSCSNTYHVTNSNSNSSREPVINREPRIVNEHPYHSHVMPLDKNNHVNHFQNHVSSNIGFTKPEMYDGTSSWNDYQIHFETVAKLNNWSEEVKALKLIACMKGSALSTLGEINVAKPPYYSDLVKILEKRFAPPNQTEMYRSQLDARQRRKGGNLPELAQDIKRLTRLAYPTAPHDLRDNLAYRSFREALNDQDLQWAICQGQISTIDEALHLALKYEAFHISHKRPFLRQLTKVDTQTTPDKRQKDDTNGDHGPITCFYCGKKGHRQNVCNKRKADKEQYLTQLTHSKKGHEGNQVNHMFQRNKGNY